MTDQGGPPRDYRWSLRVYYEDTDAGGVVYYANYLRFLERARTELLRSLGFEQERLRAERGLLFAVRSISLDYRRPARLDDELSVSARADRTGRTSLWFEQSIWRRRTDAPEDLLCEGRVQVVCLDAERFRPRPIPPEILEVLSLAR